MGYKVAVVGATGNVGREMLNVLAERNFPVSDLYALASRRSVGMEVSFGDKIVKCHDLETFDFSRDRFLPDVGGLRYFQGMVAAHRRPRARSSSIIRRPGATTRTCR